MSICSCSGSGGQCQATPVAEEEDRPGNKHRRILPHSAIPGCGQVVSNVHALTKFIAAAVMTCRPSAVAELLAITYGLDLLLTNYIIHLPPILYRSLLEIFTKIESKLIEI